MATARPFSLVDAPHHDSELSRLLLRSSHLVERSVKLQADMEASSKRLASAVALSVLLCDDRKRRRRP